MYTLLSVTATYLDNLVPWTHSPVTMSIAIDENLIYHNVTLKKKKKRRRRRRRKQKKKKKKRKKKKKKKKKMMMMMKKKKKKRIEWYKVLALGPPIKRKTKQRDREGDEGGSEHLLFYRTV